MEGVVVPFPLWKFKRCLGAYYLDEIVSGTLYPVLVAGEVPNKPLGKITRRRLSRNSLPCRKRPSIDSRKT